MLTRNQKWIIALVLVAALSFGMVFGFYGYLNNQEQPVSNTPPVSSQPTEPTEPVEPTIKTDMCGESLIGKTLPNIAYPEFAQIVLDRMLREYSIFESPAADGIPVPEGAEPNKIVAYIIDSYHYATSELSYSYPLIKYPDRFVAWSMPEKIERLNAVYAEAERIIEFLDIDETVTQKEAMIRINSYICENKAYAYGDESSIERSVYHAMFSDTGVCEHYALQFQVLCLTAGIECHYIVTAPEEDGTTHAFNKVYFSDGSYCWIDTCWNDNLSQNEAGEWVETSVNNGFDPVYVFEKRMEYMFLTDAELQRLDERKGYHEPVTYFEKHEFVSEAGPALPETDGVDTTPVVPHYNTFMCGDSLLLKVQPHTQYTDVMRYVFQHLESDEDLDCLNITGLDIEPIKHEANTKYKYLCDALTVSGSEDELVVFESEYYVQQLEQSLARVKEILTELGIDNTVTQVEAIKRINQWLIDNKEYDFTFDYSDSYIFAGLFAPEMICCHYSVAFQALCLGAGIECEYVQVDEMNHAWNKVIFPDGTHLWVDSTWNDCYMDAERYLLLTDEELSETHYGFE